MRCVHWRRNAAVPKRDDVPQESEIGGGMTDDKGAEGERQARLYFGSARYEATRVDAPPGFQRDLLGLCRGRAAK